MGRLGVAAMTCPVAAAQGAVLPHGLPPPGARRQQLRARRADADTAAPDAAAVPGGHRREPVSTHAPEAGTGEGALQDGATGTEYSFRERR